MKTLRNLLLAMINATLILIALCLFLLWQLSSTAERVTSNFADNLHVLKPVNESIQELNMEIRAFRSNLMALTTGPSDLTGHGALQVRAQLDALQISAKGMQLALDRIADTPHRLMTKAIETTSDNAASLLIGLRDCQIPDA